MSAKEEKKKPKRPSKGMRKHIRKVKQENRKANVPESGPKKQTRPS